MSRRHKRRKPVYPQDKSKKSIRLYPAVLCIKENIVIAACKIALKRKIKGGIVVYDRRHRDNHFKYWNTVFLEGYEIDFSKVSTGTKPLCPKCGSLLSFLGMHKDNIAFFSNGESEIVDDKVIAPEKLSGT